MGGCDAGAVAGGNLDVSIPSSTSGDGSRAAAGVADGAGCCVAKGVDAGTD